MSFNLYQAAVVERYLCCYYYPLELRYVHIWDVLNTACHPANYCWRS